MIAEYITVMADDEVKPGQYRHISTQAWWMAQIDQPDQDAGFYLAEHRLDYWVPFKWEDGWTLRRRNTGRVIRLSEGEPKSLRQDALHSLWPTGEWYADGGHFRYGDETKKVRRASVASWSTPDPQFLAELPLEPESLLERLAGPLDASASTTSARQFENALMLLRTGLVPANLRSSLCDALSRLPASSIIPGVINSAGVPAIGIAHKGSFYKSIVLLSQENGQFLGEQQTVADDMHDLPVGTVVTSTSVCVSVVDVVPEEQSQPSGEPVSV